MQLTITGYVCIGRLLLKHLLINWLDKKKLGSSTDLAYWPVRASEHNVRGENLFFIGEAAVSAVSVCNSLDGLESYTRSVSLGGQKISSFLQTTPSFPIVVFKNLASQAV